MTGRTVITKYPERFELVVERTFDATPERLWRCWTTPEVAAWWGPVGWRTYVHEMDVRPGGVWRYSIAPDDGEDQPVHCLAVYQQVTAPALLAFADGVAPDPDAPEPTGPDALRDVAVTVTITRRDDGTHLTITNRFTDAAHFATAGPSGMDVGLAEAFDRLHDHLIL